MHPYNTWSGFLHGYQGNFYNYVDKMDEIQVNPNLEPLWAAPSRKLERNDTIEYTGFFHGSKCKLVMAGDCKRLYPRQTEIMAALMSKEKELPHRQVNDKTSQVYVDSNKNIAQPNKKLVHVGIQDVASNEKHSIHDNQLALNVSHLTGTITQANHCRTPTRHPRRKESQRRHADESAHISRQGTTRQLRTRERTRSPEPSLDVLNKEKTKRTRYRGIRPKRNMCYGITRQVLERHCGDKTRELNNVFHNLSNTAFTKEELTVLA
jgi:hypothetical protein